MSHHLWTPEDDAMLRALVEHGYNEAEMQAEFPHRAPGEVEVRLEHLGKMDLVQQTDEGAGIKMLLAGGANLDALRIGFPHLPMSVLVALREEMVHEVVARHPDVEEAGWNRKVWTLWVTSGPDITVDDIVKENGGEDFGATRERVEAVVKKIAKQLLEKLKDNGLYDERELNYQS